MGDTSTGTFDMQSWQGLTKVLQAGRDAQMDPETYAEFRDNVLRYAQSGGTDTALRARIEELLPAFKDMESSEKTPSEPEKEVQKQVAPPENLPMEGENQSVKKEETPEPEPAPKPEPVPESTPSPVSPAPAGELMSADEAKERIAEIKHAVTEYVGNPVTLVSEDEKIGRAYMQALLSAMKAVSGNAPGTLRSSMQALEDVYKQVLTIEVGKKKKEETPEPKPAPKPEPKPEPVPEPTPTSPVVEQEHTISSLDERIQMVKEKAAQKSQISIPKETPEPEPAPKPEPEPAPTPEKKEIKVEEQNKQKPFVTPDLPDGSKDIPKDVTDDLYTPEIEEGMAQLLSEWRIFKGEKKLFGRGPGGKEHPLFQRLKDMIMFDIISGHFEGAEKDVVLSIRDYANAWRNEQGVVYAPSESFDHYLRRVIRRIIKRSS